MIKARLRVACPMLMLFLGEHYPNSSENGPQNGILQAKRECFTTPKRHIFTQNCFFDVFLSKSVQESWPFAIVKNPLEKQQSTTIGCAMSHMCGNETAYSFCTDIMEITNGLYVELDVDGLSLTASTRHVIIGC